MYVRADRSSNDSTVAVNEDRIDAKSGTGLSGDVADSFVRRGNAVCQQHDESSVVMPMIPRIGGQELRVFSTIITFGTPTNEIAIESYCPQTFKSAAYFTE